MKKVLIIGGGASGLMAGIAAALNGASVTILEAKDRPGKKLLMTGNGRCNLTNAGYDFVDLTQTAQTENVGITKQCHIYHSVADTTDVANESEAANKSVSKAETTVAETTETGTADSSDFIKTIFQQFSGQDTCQFFESAGLLLTEKNGSIYPYTGQAASVLEILLLQLSKLKVKLKYSEKTERIYYEQEQWHAKTGSWTYTADSLVLCCGSKAVPITGSDGSGYELARQAGHSITTILPALVPLVCSSKLPKLCAGVRCPARITLLCSKTSVSKTTDVKVGDTKNYTAVFSDVYSETGELQWTEYGISGIAVFQISRYAALTLAQKGTVLAVLDLLPDLSKEQLAAYVERQRQQYPDCSAVTALAGLLPKKLLSAVLEHCSIKPSVPMKQLDQQKLNAFCIELKRLELPVQAVKSFDQCQVCAGGVPILEVNPQTLESKKAPGLYFAGELLDIDGPCGGYNLQWAWSSGYTAGKHAAV